MIVDVEVTDVGAGRRGDIHRISRSAGGTVGKADAAGDAGDGQAAAGVTAERPVTERVEVAGLIDQDRSLGRIQGEIVIRTAGRRIDAEFGIEVVYRGEIRCLAIREAEGDIEEAAVVLRGDADHGTVLRAGDRCDRSLHGEGLGDLAVTTGRRIDNRTGPDHHTDRADIKLARDIEAIHVAAEMGRADERIGDQCGHAGAGT